MRIPRKGFMYCGLPGLSTALIGAMVFGSSDVVEILLESGASPYITDKNGNDPLMCACVYGRLDNVKFWLERNSFKDWNLETRGTLGNVAMGNAVYMGPDRFKLVKYLLKRGAKFDSVTDNGTSNLMSACANEDADPRVVKLFLENVTQNTTNQKIRAKTTWRSTRRTQTS
mgnify:CR=1 FL=1